jgi:alpha-L-fucosidase
MRIRAKPGLILFGAVFVAAVLVAPPSSAQMTDRGGGPGDRETDPLVLKRLEWFQDVKFGLMMHWGPYSQWGVVESWSICSEDEPWCRRRIPDYVEYKRQYEALKTTFNPTHFDPARWADAARGARDRLRPHGYSLARRRLGPAEIEHREPSGRTLQTAL